MDIESILQKFMSGDSHLVWSASWDVIKASKQEISEFPLTKISDVRNSVQMLNDESNRDIYQLAVSILDNIEQGICRCNCYPSSQRLLPEEEQERNFISIEKKEDIPWEPEFACSCIECGKKYFVHESHSYHYPWAEWRNIT